jgi:hypothetical protein
MGALKTGGAILENWVIQHYQVELMVFGSLGIFPLLARTKTGQRSTTAISYTWNTKEIRLTVASYLSGFSVFLSWSLLLRCQILFRLPSGYLKVPARKRHSRTIRVDIR